MEFTIRNEEEKDYFEVENVIREAFWNIYRPGCNEHLVTHNFRTNASFIKELDFVIEKEGEIIGNIIYSYVKLKLDHGGVKKFICFGPIGIRPDYQGMGLGGDLIRYSLAEAKKLGYTVVFITGNHNYYHKFGFESASKYGVYLDEKREGESTYFMVKSLIDGALTSVKGILEFDCCFDPSKEELEEFDEKFPLKLKEKREGQFA
ncbi:MAG: GNAT family N-acetyltransferase [Lachnotalea sp.]